MDIFNIFSGVCSIVGLFLSCISLAKINKIYKITRINQSLDNSIKIKQTGIGIGNQNHDERY